MYLLKLTVSKDAKISRRELEDRLEYRNLPDVLGAERVATDAIRCALADRLRPFSRFERPNMLCKAISASPLRVERGHLHTEIHVQERSTAGVEYTAQVCTIKYGLKDGLTWEKGIDYDTYFHIVDALDIYNLLNYGLKMLFEPDIRRIFSALTDTHTLKFWNGGTYVCLTESAMTSVQAVALLFNNLDSGQVLLRVISVDNSKDNKQSVAHELGEDVFSKSFEKLTERARKKGANPERLEQEYTDLLAKITETETWLGCAIPCQDAQEGFESALSELFV